ncbi:phophatidylserine decarboxylase associated domain-containing protein [Romeriopsis navalis]|uniref:phophatidylserine decarboxylase associated domain-containing protein n=1 Tax=Romeriopsis navalis TaxID=2992132 RepID=UPI0021F827B0|nr:phophatidylserine decarboxylase associated domain-containing protein [Romeriopsis navalis]
MTQIKRLRPGGWLFHDREHIDLWVRALKAQISKSPQALVLPIREFKAMVDQDPVLNLTMESMFKEAAILKQQTPLGTPEVKDFEEFLMLLNGIMIMAPQYTECPNSDGAEAPCGLIGFPINALLDWPMATSFGYTAFSNQLINQQFKKVLNYWSTFLLSKESRYVLVEDFPEQIPKVLAWLSPVAKQKMVDVACKASNDSTCQQQPFEHFFNCDPSDPYYGFKSWDDFFT